MWLRNWKLSLIDREESREVMRFIWWISSHRPWGGEAVLMGKKLSCESRLGCPNPSSHARPPSCRSPNCCINGRLIRRGSQAFQTKQRETLRDVPKPLIDWPFFYLQLKRKQRKKPTSGQIVPSGATETTPGPVTILYITFEIIEKFHLTFHTSLRHGLSQSQSVREHNWQRSSNYPHSKTIIYWFIICL